MVREGLGEAVARCVEQAGPGVTYTGQASQCSHSRCHVTRDASQLACRQVQDVTATPACPAIVVLGTGDIGCLSCWSHLQCQEAAEGVLSAAGQDAV